QRGLSPENLSRYFRPHEEGWRIQDELRSMVEFRTLNLHHDLDSVGGPFDIIFCRNVAIYFADAAREHLFRRLSETLAPHGALFVGAQESLDQYDLPLIKQQHCRCMFYCGPKSDLLVA
ncbi:MAG: CheR family methyltransferase, partial [Planctomycetota bacterium]